MSIMQGNPIEEKVIVVRLEKAAPLSAAVLIVSKV